MKRYLLLTMASIWLLILSPVLAEEPHRIPLSNDSDDYWNSAVLQIKNTTQLPGVERKWIDVLPSGHGALLLINGPEDLPKSGFAPVYYLRHGQKPVSTDTLYTYQLAFDGVLPLANLDKGGNLVLLHLAAGWARRGGVKSTFAESYQLERKGWLILSQDQPRFIWGIDGNSFHLTDFPAAIGNDPGLDRRLDFIQISNIVESPTGALAIAGQVPAQGGLPHNRVLVTDSHNNAIRSLDIQARRLIWVGEQLYLATRTAAWIFDGESLNSIAEWPGHYKPVFLEAENGAPLLVLSTGAKPTREGWQHDALLILSGQQLQKSYPVTTPVLIRHSAQVLEIGGERHFIGRRR